MAEGRGSLARRLLLLITAPTWAGPFLLIQAIHLSGAGLLQLLDELRGKPSTSHAVLVWLVGIPGLVLFPVAVGLRGLFALIDALGARILGGGKRRKPPLDSAGLVPGGSAPGAAPSRRKPSRLARFVVGALAMLLLPAWLPFALAYWLIRWVLWDVLVPEAARAFERKRPGASERIVTFVGLRYLYGRRTTALHSATNYFAAAGIALGVCALIIVLAVMSGFDEEVRERIVGTNAHVIVLRWGSQGIAKPDSIAAILRGHPEAVAAAPFVYGKAMLTAGTNAEGGIVKGIRWKDEAEVTALPRYLEHKGGDPGLAAPKDGGLPGIILGRYIAEGLGVGRGDEIVLVSPAEARRTPMGFVPRMRRFEVRGIFHSGMYDFDASMVYIDMGEASSFFGLGERVTGIELRLKDMNQAPRVAEEMVGLLGGFPYRANNWIELNENLFAWMSTEKKVMFIILTMIVLVAGFSIASSLIMLVTEKRREIGILKSMGATSLTILRIFVLEGWVMAFAGTALGTGAGLVICYLLKRYEFIRLPGDVYFIDKLPVKVEGGDLAVIVASVLVIAALSTFYPAWKAARMHPVDAIRDE